MSQLIFLESVLAMPLAMLPVRSPLIQLASAKILISPGSKLSPEQIKSAGSLTHIIAPSLLHVAGMKAAHQVYPRAEVWGALGSFQSKPEIPWTMEISDSNWPFASELEIVALNGIPKINEIIFFHKESRSLILTDLAFNLTKADGLGEKLIYGLFGTYRRFAVSRLFAKFVKDRPAFEMSLKKIFEWDFDNIIVSHGENISGNGKSILREALQERGFLI